MPDKNVLEGLANILNTRPRTGTFGWTTVHDPLNTAPEGLPDVPPPPIFRPATEVIGGPRLQQAVESLLQAAPELRGRINKVQAAPTSGAIDLATASALKPHELPDTNLAGQWSPRSKTIYINPRSTGDMWSGGLERDPVESTLAHEFGHARGYTHGKHIDELEKLGSQMVPETVYPNAAAYGRGKR